MKSAFKLSLTAKSLSLVGIPLLFEVAMICLMSNLLHQSEAEAEQAMRAREISDRVNELTLDIYTIWQGTSKASRDERLSQVYLLNTLRNSMAKLKGQYARLMELTADEPALRLNIEHSSKAIGEVETILAGTLKQVNEGNIAEALANYKATNARLRYLFTGLVSQELLLVSKHEEYVAKTSNERQAAIRKQITGLVPVALVGNVLLSILLAIFLVRQITARLALLNENISRFGRHQKLIDVNWGSDEITALDSAFRDMAASIELANQRKDEFVHTLTHDLRSPLSTIQGTLELAEIGQLGELNERGERLFASASRNGSRMMNMIDSLLDIYKMEEGKLALELAPVCVDEIFDEVEGNMRAWLAENSVTLEIKKSGYKAMADRDKLSQVVFNLVANAFKYSPPKSTISLSANKDGDKIEFTVSDQGPGIPESLREIVFERFRQVESLPAGEIANSVSGRQAAGSGLGLFICRSIVELHGGEIWLTERVGGGCVFHFTVPVFNEATALPAAQ